jgi:serine/threonine protein kinase
MLSSLKSPSADKSDNLNLQKLLGLPDVNILIFPNDPIVHIFDLDDFKFQARLYAASNVIENYIYIPTRRLITIKFTPIPTPRAATQLHDRYDIIRLTREIETHRELIHSPNIVAFYGFCVCAHYALICMEPMDISLKDLYIRAHEIFGYFPETLLGNIAVSTLNALSDCSKHDIIHRDIKPQNILINKRGEVKLCDFGVSRIMDDAEASTYVGTLLYWPPERFSEDVKRFDSRADVWSLGITLVEVAYGTYPRKLHEPLDSTNIFAIQQIVHAINPELVMQYVNSPFMNKILGWTLQPHVELTSQKSRILNKPANNTHALFAHRIFKTHVRSPL